MRLLLFLALALFAIPTFAQTDTLTKDEANLLGTLLAIELEAERCGSFGAATEKCLNAKSELASIYDRVAKSPRLIRYLAAQAVNNYQKVQNAAKSAPQASQIADQQNARLMPLLVIQNQRIIELLEALLKKPR